MNKAAETIAGGYFTMPDGQVMQKMSDGKWVSVQDRLDSAEKSITERFKGTETIPNEWHPHSSPNIFKNTKHDRTIEYLITVSPTHRHLHQHLIEMVGCPTDIIKNNGLLKNCEGKTLRSAPATLRTAEKIMESLNCEPWNTVLKVIRSEKE
jgi:hypothetical protein